ncbi:MAG TPA: UbiA family prenyltransferase, partial [Candidatus Bilamarchaeum sp.]|nr:UbiA family prenyltransferase [Candidatus Bilamarchaeum sp.]
MSEQYVREGLLEFVIPINGVTGAGQAFVGYRNAYDAISGYVDDRLVSYRNLASNIYDIMMPNRAFTAVFSLNAGLLMGGVFDAQSAVLGSLALISTYGCGAVYNNIKDIEADKINSSSRPLASGALSVEFASSLMMLLAVAGIALAYLVSPILAAACLLEAVLGVIYSKYTKAMGILAYATLVTTHMAVPLIAGSLIAGAFGFKAIAIAAFLYITEVLAVSIKDYKDIEGDRKTGLRTLPIIYGPKDAAKLTFLGLCLPLLLVWIPWTAFKLSGTFIGMYMVIGISRYTTGKKI